MAERLFELMLREHDRFSWPQRWAILCNVIMTIAALLSMRF